ncbi:MAG: hypothetical protein U9Q22_08055 [Candidatus Altiarchaeota archaeon]|nr:hypothetical protein [Candidatus Altiarchaeota archaeon]
MKGKKIIKIAVIALVSILLILSLGLFILISLDKNPEPEEIIKETGFFHTESTLFLRDIVRYPLRANVTPLRIADNKIKVGVSIETDELNFGVVSENLTVRKFINLKNNDKVPVKMCIPSYGNIKPYILLSKNNFILKEGQALEVEIAFNATKVGIYSGELDVIAIKPKHPFLANFFGWVECG